MKKKVSILINSLAGGGAERVVSILLDGLKNDYELYLVLLYKSEGAYEIPATVKRIFLSEELPPRNFLYKLIEVPIMGVKYQNFCKKENIDISLSFLIRANFISTICKSTRTSVVISERVHTISYYQAQGFIQKNIGLFLTKMLYNRADTIVPNSFQTAFALRNTLKITKPKYKVIYNPTTVVNDVAEKVQNRQNTFTFIMVGRLTSQKNYSLLIDACELIIDLDFKVLILGEGTEFDSLLILIKNKGLANKISLLGFRKNVKDYLLESDCFLLTSDYEGFPNVLLEALSCSLPVVSTDCNSGPREILSPRTEPLYQTQEKLELAEFGILLPVGNHIAFAEAMKIMIENDDLRISFREKAKNRAADFDVNKISTQFKNLLEDEKQD